MKNKKDYTSDDPTRNKQTSKYSRNKNGGW